MVTNPPASAGDTGDTSSIPGLGRSPGGENDNPLQYSCWRIPWTEEPGGLQSMGSQSDTTERLRMHGRLRKWKTVTGVNSRRAELVRIMNPLLEAMVKNAVVD